jgi:uncharacterized protein DUF4440
VRARRDEMRITVAIWLRLIRYIADDCLISTDDGALVTKADLMKHLKVLPSRYDQIDNAREFSVRLHGNAAVISLRSTAHEQFGDTDIVTEQRRTETWTKRDGAWILVAVQTGNLPRNFRKPVDTVSGNYKTMLERTNGAQAARPMSSRAKTASFGPDSMLMKTNTCRLAPMAFSLPTISGA